MQKYFLLHCCTRYLQVIKPTVANLAVAPRLLHKRLMSSQPCVAPTLLQTGVECAQIIIHCGSRAVYLSYAIDVWTRNFRTLVHDKVEVLSSWRCYSVSGIAPDQWPSSAAPVRAKREADQRFLLELRLAYA